MKIKLLLLFIIIGIYGARAQYTAIPDIYFEYALIEQGYDNGAIDHKVLTASINKVTSLYLNSKSIARLTGIQDFVALTELYCYRNPLKSLNVSGLTALTTLFCVENQLTSLNVSGLTNLEYLNCSFNQLTSLDVSGLSNLQTLNCEYNRLMSLDVSGLTNLTDLNCDANQLTSINVSGLTKLKKLNCSINQLTSLDLSGLTNLETLKCSINQLTSLDVSGLTNLETLNCLSNQLTGLNVSGLTGLIYFCCVYNPLLSCIQVDDVAVANTIKDWFFKDATASYSTNCALSTSNPQITPHAVTVFPNPAKEVLNVKSSSLILQTEIYDTNGRTVLSSNQNSENAVLNISSLVNGLYFVTVKTQEGLYKDKILKK